MTEAQQFRKKPVVIKALQYTGANVDDVKAFAGEHFIGGDESQAMIGTLEGPHTASVGDWIIEGVAGEHYPCKPDIFHKTYDPA